VIGLLGVTAWSVAQSACTSWPYVGIAVVSLPLALWPKVPVFFVLLGAGLLGAVIGITFG
jgi:chromate transport protein ChrA